MNKDVYTRSDVGRRPNSHRWGARSWGAGLPGFSDARHRNGQLRQPFRRCSAAGTATRNPRAPRKSCLNLLATADRSILRIVCGFQNRVRVDLFSGSCADSQNRVRILRIVCGCCLETHGHSWLLQQNGPLQPPRIYPRIRAAGASRILGAGGVSVLGPFRHTRDGVPAAASR